MQKKSISPGKIAIIAATACLFIGGMVFLILMDVPEGEPDDIQRVALESDEERSRERAAGEDKEQSGVSPTVKEDSDTDVDSPEQVEGIQSSPGTDLVQADLTVRERAKKVPQKKILSPPGYGRPPDGIEAQAQMAPTDAAAQEPFPVTAGSTEQATEKTGRDSNLAAALGAKKLVDGWKSSWSPDGTQLAYLRDDEAGVKILDLKTGDSRVVTQSGKDPVWSPDGRHIAFVDLPGHQEEKEAVWIVQPDGLNARRLMQGGYPNWSGDGKTLYIHSRSKNKIFAWDVDDPDASPSVVYESPLSRYPAFSPDGKFIAFGVRDALIIVNRDSGAEIMRWPTLGSPGLLPSWSPDGKKVAFGSYALAAFGLWVADIEKDSVVQVAKGRYTSPAWSKDGSKLSFGFRAATPREIWVVETSVLDGLTPSTPQEAPTQALAPAQALAEAQQRSKPNQGTISGRVYDEATGAGVQGAHIQVFSKELLDEYPMGMRSPHSDQLGRYKTMALDPGEYFIVPRRVPGFVQKAPPDGTTVVLKFGENLEGIDFPLSKGVSISGTVRDPENNPVSGIQIIASASTIFRAGKVVDRSEPQGATSNATGDFEITGFEPGAQIRISAGGEGFAGMTVGTWSLPEGGLRDVKVVLVPESTIAGRVVDKDGNPVSRKQIYIGGKRPDGGFTVSGLPARGSASDGSYKLTGLASGTYRVSVPQPAEMEKAKVVEVGRGEHVKGIDLPYHVPWLTISGRVTDRAGKPWVRAQVKSWGPRKDNEPIRNSEHMSETEIKRIQKLNSEDYGGLASQTSTNADGRYVLKVREEGKYKLQVRGTGRRRAGVQQVWKMEEGLGVPAGSEDVDFVLTPESTFQGRVIDAQGRPVPNKGVRLDALSPAGDILVTRRADTDAKGTFRITQLAAGRYRLRVYRPDQQEAAMSDARVVEIAVGEHVTGQDLLFDASGLTISGRVTDPEGRPIARADVFCSRPDFSLDISAGDFPAHSTTDSDGRYVIEDLKEGNYKLFITKDVGLIEIQGIGKVPDIRSQHMEVEAGTEKVDVVLEQLQYPGFQPQKK